MRIRRSTLVRQQIHSPESGSGAKPGSGVLRAAIIASSLMIPSVGAADTPEMPAHKLVDGLSPKLLEDIAKRRTELATALQRSSPGSHPAKAYAIVRLTQRWQVGQTLRVAFLGGETSLYKLIEESTADWIKPGRANLHFSFRNADGTYRTWSRDDKAYQAEIRVAFSLTSKAGKYWSLVGTQSTDENASDEDAGGNAYQASLNLGGFDQHLPSDWRAVVLHEFGHAIGFEHEHQARPGGCDFRFADDPGYVLSHDEDGWVSLDDQNRRPGLYAYLGGPENRWPPDKVDANLKAFSDRAGMTIGPFDKHSIMMYNFDPFFFEGGIGSPCYTAENMELSDEDIAGVTVVYPDATTKVAAILKERKDAIGQLLRTGNATRSLRSHLQKLQAVQ